METLKGIAASPGIAIGPAYVVKPENNIIEPARVKPAAVASEARRYNAALERTLADIDKSEMRALELFGQNYAELMEAHKLILADPMLRTGVLQKIETQHLSAESALIATVQEINASFEGIKDEFFRERKFDIADVTKRLLENLTNKKQNKFLGIKEAAVVIAHNLYPSDTINLKSNKVLGFATDIGGKTSHTAILAQSMQMPAVVGMGGAAAQVNTGDIVILDGEAGLLIIRPDEATIAAYQKRKGEFAEAEKSLQSLSDLPNETRDGHKVALYVNYDPRRDMKEWDAFNSEGLGLLRTEFIYMDRALPPGEDEQFKIYQKAAARFGARPITIRLADLGGDKATDLGLERADDEDNPFMGRRGVRLLLKYPELMRTQLRAIARAAQKAEGEVSILIPMVSGVSEVLEVKKIFAEVLTGLEAQKIKPKTPIKIGAMIEVPSAAFTMDALLPEVDFVSIGTNDLIQYLLAVDRVNQEVAYLYDPYHPAVLRTINWIIASAHNKGKKVSICGEIASDPEMVPFLVGLGLDVLSVTPRMFLRIKNTLRNLSFKHCSNLAQAAVLLPTPAEIKKLKEHL